jgi:quinol monooxygenase YgiN
MTNAAVRVVLKVRARPDKVAELTALLRELAAQSRREHGCVDYQVLQSSADPAEFVAIEAWSDGAALDAHMTTPHVQAAFAKAPEVLAAAPERGVYAPMT